MAQQTNESPDGSKRSSVNRSLLFGLIMLGGLFIAIYFLTGTALGALLTVVFLAATVLEIFFDWQQSGNGR